MQQHASSWREQGTVVACPSRAAGYLSQGVEMAGVGGGCFLEWKGRIMQRVAFPVVVPLVAPVLSDCVRLIPGSARYSTFCRRRMLHLSSPNVESGILRRE